MNTSVQGIESCNRGVHEMEHGPTNADKPANFGEADATRHLRDHLECAQKLARSQNLHVIHYLIEMAILALSYRGTPPDAPPKA